MINIDVYYKFNNNLSETRHYQNNASAYDYIERQKCELVADIVVEETYIQCYENRNYRFLLIHRERYAIKSSVYNHDEYKEFKKILKNYVY